MITKLHRFTVQFFLCKGLAGILQLTSKKYHFSKFSDIFILRNEV